ncbi:hypothetical protein FRC10_003602 [Ceratobasidium sp. 414]|nr:hypothetical protein FRC10_003602 [Ceratobasidium sp. 414]
MLDVPRQVRHKKRRLRRESHGSPGPEPRAGIPKNPSLSPGTCSGPNPPPQPDHTCLSRLDTLFHFLRSFGLMFTPPASPLPVPHDPLATALAGSQSEKCAPAKEPALKVVARRQRLIALIVPVVILVLISLASRRAACDPLVDHFSGTPPAPRQRHTRAGLKPRHHLPRQLTDPADQVPTATSTSTAPDATAPQQLGAGTAAVPAIPSVPWPVPTPFPQPFDSSLAFNFSTTTCASFFNQFTTNITFRACRPFSLLLGTSTSFFDIQSNLTELTAVMGGTCDAPQPVDRCRSTMDWLAAEIAKPTACAAEIASQDAVVLEALNGFKTYDLMRQAGFVEAVASTSPSDTYFYALPLGSPVPQKSAPSCSACIKSLMALYANHATDSTLPLSKVYPSAQKFATSSCGTDYAIAVANSALRRVAGPWSLGTFSLLVGIWTYLL